MSRKYESTKEKRIPIRRLPKEESLSDKLMIGTPGQSIIDKDVKLVKKSVQKLKEALYHEVGLFWDLRHYNIAKREIDKIFGGDLI